MKLSKTVWLAAGAVVVVLIAVAGWRVVQARRALPEGLIQTNGRIEGDQVSVASKLAGRIATIAVHEGDSVQAGQVLAVMDAEQVKARVAQAEAAAAALAAQQAAAEVALATLRQQVPLDEQAAGAGVTQAEASLRKAEAARAQAERDAQRMEDLALRGSVAAQRAELARLSATSAGADATAARETVARAHVTQAQAVLGRDRIRAKENELAAVKAQHDQAQAAWDEARSVLNDLTLKAPSAGVVMTRVREPGETVAAGSPIVTLVDLDHLYLKAYVAESQIGRLRLGLPAQVWTDAFPGQPFAATVKNIAQKAEFTPKEVQTPDERVKLTYAVKLTINSNPNHRLTPGVPADAVVRWKDDVAWRQPQW